MNVLCEFDLEDPDLRVEIDLVSELMIAAAACEGALDQQTIDDVLAAVGGGNHGGEPPVPPRVVAQRTPDES